MGVSPGQSWEFMSGIATHIPWGQMSSFKIQQIMSEPGWQERVARRMMQQIEHNFPAFPEAGSNILKLDNRLFGPAEFIGHGWTIWKGPEDGDGLYGKEEQDERSLALSEVNLTDVYLRTMLENHEGQVSYATWLERLKRSGLIRLDAKVFQTFWENQNLIPERWKEKTNGHTTYIYFDGTILRDPGGLRHIIFLCWTGMAWRWRTVWAGHDFHLGCFSAVLPKSA